MTDPATPSEAKIPSAPSPAEGQTEEVHSGRPALSNLAQSLQRAAVMAGSGDSEEMARAERRALRRVEGLSTELEDVADVEYRALRLERVVLAGIYDHGGVEEAETSLRELAALADTAGSHVLDGILQRRKKPDPATYLGPGKARELADIVRAVHADTVIVDTELSPSQRRGLEDVVGVKVIDRTALILDIFAQHAKSKEGKAQVELAQLQYLLPRLRGWGESMSRQAGGRAASGEGIGSRGPGETKMEIDRRHIGERMARLRKIIKTMGPARATKRASRRRSGIPGVVLVGYTNAGKSSLLNELTGAGVLVENALFATLDPTVRRGETPEGRAFTISDTVGFVRSLPTQLIEAFRSSLEEVAEADLLLHVVDAAHPDIPGQIAAVREVLADIDGVDEIAELLVFNKIDLADPLRITTLRTQYPNAVHTSTVTGEGMDELRARFDQMLPRPQEHFHGTVPYDRGDLIAQAHELGEVRQEAYSSAGTELDAMVDPALFAQLQAAATPEATDAPTPSGEAS